MIACTSTHKGTAGVARSSGAGLKAGLKAIVVRDLIFRSAEAVGVNLQKSKMQAQISTMHHSAAQSSPENFVTFFQPKTLLGPCSGGSSHAMPICISHSTRCVPRLSFQRALTALHSAGGSSDLLASLVLSKRLVNKRLVARSCPSSGDRVKIHTKKVPGSYVCPTGLPR